MRINRFSWLLAAAFLLPAVHAGTATAPELTDASGDAPGPVDVTAAWFAAYAPPQTTGTELDCDLATCREGITVTVKLRDLFAAAPLADEDPLSLRYFYTIQFTPETWGQVVTVNCVLTAADILIGNVNTLQNPEFGVGSDCRIPNNSGVAGGAFDVASSAPLFGHQSQTYSMTTVYVDRSAGTFSVTLVEDLADIGPGDRFTGLKVTTSVGGYATSGVFKTVADTTGVGTDWIVQ